MVGNGKRVWVGLTVALIAVAGWTGTASAQAASAAAAGGIERPGDPEAITLPPEIARVLRDYERAWAARDADALAALFSEEGFVLRPGGAPARGRDAIRISYADSGGPLALWAWEYQTSGDIGYILGGWGSTRDGPRHGKFVLTIRRGDDGRWLITADMDNQG